jgi:hypothetical protein
MTHKKQPTTKKQKHQANSTTESINKLETVRNRIGTTKIN